MPSVVKIYSIYCRSRLLACIALGAGLASMWPGPGVAQLTVNNGVVSNTGTTATDGTTNTNRNAGANTSFLQMFNTAGPTVGMNTGTISGNGLALDATATTLLGDTVSMVNTGIIQPTNNFISALSMITDGGSVTYSGSGSVLNNPANGDGLVANGSGLFNTVGGDVTVTAGGAISGNQGIVASTNLGGNVTVTTSSNVTSADGANGSFTPQFAVNSLTENGTSTVRVNSGIVTGGISSQASVSGGSLVEIDGGTIQSIANSAINAHTLNGPNQVTINGGTLNGAAGQPVVNAFTDFTGTGGVNVAMHGGTIDGTVNGSSFGILATTGVAPVGTTFDATATGNVVVQTDAGSNILMNGGTGISAAVFGTAGSVTATLGGKIGTPNVGFDAFIDNSMNRNDVIIHVNNAVDAVQIGGRARIQAGTGNVFVDGAGAIGGGTAPNQFGLVANNNGGTGGVTVAGAGPVTSTGTAIAATVTAGGAGNVLVQRSGAINGGIAFRYNPNTLFGAADPTQGAGITATTNGVGTVTVQANGGVTATGGIGILARGGAPFLAGQSAVSVDTTGGLVTAMGTGAVGNDAIVANATGSGSILVKTDAVTEKTGANNAINAAGTTGAITVQANGAITGGAAATGILATNTTGNGANAISVTTKGLVIGGAGIDAGNTGTASPVMVTAQRGVTAGAGFGIRARSTTGSVAVDSTGGLVQATGGDAVIASSTTGAIQVSTGPVTATGGNGIVGTSKTGGISVSSAGPVTSDVATGIIGLQTGVAAGGSVQVLSQNTVSGVVGVNAAAVSTNDLTVTVGNNVTGTAGNGIVSTVAAGTANINVANVGTTVTGTGAATSGIDSTTGAGGITKINIAAGALVTDMLGRGITTNAIGSGVTKIANSGTIVGAGTTANPVISIANATGTVMIDNNGPGLIANNKTATAAANNALAVATMTPAAIAAYNINNSGNLIGAIALGAGANTFTNLGGGQWVASDGATFSAAAFGGGATNFLNNNLNGTIFTGTPTAGSVANFFGLQTISNAGKFYAGNSTASLTNLNPNPGTAQTVTNSGGLNVNGALNIANLGTEAAGSNFTNGTPSAPGTIDMSQFAAATAADGTVFPANTHAVTDRVTLGTIAIVGTSDQNYQYTFGPSYNYVGTPGQSVLNLDANLGPAGSASDRLIVSGTAMGKTAINLWDTSTVSNAFNPTGITLAAVNGASANAFFLNGQVNPARQIPGSPLFDLYEPNVGPMGAIKKGFFFDPLLQDTAGFVTQGGSAAGSRYALFGLPDIEAFQLPIAITAAQNTWDQTTLGWLDRQDELRNWMSRFTAANATGTGADLPFGSKPGGIETAKPGFWLKAIGSWSNRDVSRGLGDIVPAAGVLGNFNLGYHQDTYAIIGGVDSSKESIFTAADAAVVGVMGGYIQSNLNFKQSPTSFRFTGGTVGGSFIYLNSGWFADGLIKADLLNLNMNFPTLGEFGSAATTVSATNLGGLVDFGHRWDGSAGLWSAGYIEPIGTLSYVRTQFDNFSLSGQTAKLGPGKSFRGAVGVRGGNIWISTPEYEVESSVTAKVWDQFTTQNGVTLQVSDLTLDDRYSKVFGELTAQINVTNNTSGWSGYVRSGAKFNTQFSTVYAKAGVTYQW